MKQSVISEPHFWEDDLNDEDSFVIIACDGKNRENGRSCGRYDANGVGCCFCKFVRVLFLSLALALWEFSSSPSSLRPHASSTTSRALLASFRRAVGRVLGPGLG